MDDTILSTQRPSAQSLAHDGIAAFLPAGSKPDLNFGVHVAEALRGPGADRIAFRHGDRSMSRADLLGRACDLARRLRDKGLPLGAPVAVEIAHGLDLPVALIGVLLAGGCAVPLDPGVSQARRDAIRSDIAAPLSLRSGEGSLPDPRHGILIECEGDLGHRQYDPELAFIVYTSGSSGAPKGVEISHKSYLTRLELIASNAGGESGAKVDLAWTPSSFIGMLDEFFYSLLTGVPIVIADPGVRTDARAFADLVAQHKVTRFRITPSLLDAFLTAGVHRQLQGVKSIFCSGETMGAALQAKVRERLPARVINFYGATEAPGVGYQIIDPAAPPTATTTCQLQPFAEARVVLADGSDASEGQTGEIWIAGAAVARGYWQRPDLTSDKFVLDQGKRWYRTGDRGQWTQDGALTVLGRTDLSEVKIHGVRIDLAEVTSALRDLDGVAEAWVSAVPLDAGRDPVLVGHCVLDPESPFDPEVARTRVAQVLPALAVPRLLLSHEAFPRLQNGKLDMQALAEAAKDAALRQTRKKEPPSGSSEVSPMQIAVLNCFELALGKRQLSADDDFFAAGGTSLEAVTLAMLVSEHFDTDIGLDEVWLYPSARALCGHLQGRTGTGDARTFFHVEGMSGANLLAIGFGVAHLAGLWPDRRLFVSPGLTGDPRISLQKRLQDYVAEYLAGLRRVQPTGPYQLIGFSFAGLLAYELARQLHAAGDEIKGIALIEPVTPLGHRQSRSYGTTAATEIARSLVTGQAKRARLLMQLVGRSLSGNRSKVAPDLPAAYGHLVMSAERLQPLPVPVDLIYSDVFDPRATARWQQVAGADLRLHKVTATEHTGLIKPDCIQQWKAVLEAW